MSKLKKRLYNEHYPSILVTFFGTTEHFSGRTGALRWSILVGKQKHNVQKPSLLLLNDVHKWRPKMYSFVSVLTLKKHFFCVLSMQTRQVRPLFMHSVYDHESERTKISLRGDISLQLRHILLLHFNDFMIPTNSALIAENQLERTWGRGGGGGDVQGARLNPLN